jgi:hypothetical protein
MRVTEVLKRIFGPKAIDVTRRWGNLHDQELHGLYSWPSKISNYQDEWYEMGRLVSRTGEKKNAYRLLVGYPERKRPLKKWT